MSAYIVFIKDREHDAATFRDYGAKAQASLAGRDCKVLAAYGAIETLEGPDAQGTVMIEFPSVDEARAWYNSPAYQEARKLRFASADYRVFITAGL